MIKYLFLFLFLSVSTAQAATIHVNTTDDELNGDGDCSLREAIQSSDNNTAVDGCEQGVGLDTVILPAGTYTLTLGELTVSTELTLQGESAATTTIDANDSSRVLHVDTSLGGDFTFKDLTLTNGLVSGDGGNLLFNDQVRSYIVFEGLQVSHGESLGTNDGGGIHVQGSYATFVEVNNCVFDGNEAYLHGGGLSVEAADMDITNSIFTSNSSLYGGGLAGKEVVFATVDSSEISGNSSNIIAGGIYLENPSDLLHAAVTNSTVSGNTANDAAGLFVQGLIGTELAIFNSTITENVSASTSTAAGVKANFVGEFSVGNSIIANNRLSDGAAADCAAEGDARLISLGYNLIGVSSSDCNFSSDITTLYGSESSPLDPELGSLAFNGGSTQTHLPAITSLAINAGNPLGCSDASGSLLFDQRGQSRPDTYAGVCDIGAVEVELSCGDGRVDAAETCDDGNLISGDGCNSVCVLEYCGDGLIQSGEVCDDGNLIDTDACPTSCLPAECGDGFTQASLEECDDSNTLNNDGCTSTCVIERCGDGLVQSHESCDDGNTDEGDGCDAECILESCGDGQLQGAELCDDGNELQTDDCLSSCLPASCGDGFLLASVEECDDGNLVSLDGCDDTCQLESSDAGTGTDDPDDSDGSDGAADDDPDGGSGDDGTNGNDDDEQDSDLSLLALVNDTVNFTNFPLNVAVRLVSPDPRQAGLLALSVPQSCSCQWVLEGMNSNFLKTSQRCESLLHLSQAGHGTLSVTTTCGFHQQTYATALTTELKPASSGCSLQLGQSENRSLWLIFMVLQASVLVMRVCRKTPSK